jgi:hypothetical protein
VIVKDVKDRIVEFLTDIGLDLEEDSVIGETFLPGISVVDQTIRYETGKLLYPGDLLHEAGHLAVLSPVERAQAAGNFEGDGGCEMAAIAWSYAACLHIELPPELLFHTGGYKNEAHWLLETYSTGSYIGLPILEWKGMASSKGEVVYPRMRRWLCDANWM